MSDQLRAAHQRLGYGTRTLPSHGSSGALNEHDVRHIRTILHRRHGAPRRRRPETVNGHTLVGRCVTALWPALPDFDLSSWKNLLADDGHRAAARLRVTGTATGPYEPPGFAATYRRLTTEFGGFSEFKGERVKPARIIVDTNDVAIQIGAAPRAQSPAEWLAVAMRRLNARRSNA